MQSKSPNTVNKVVEEVPSVGCTMGERRNHCPYYPTKQSTQFLLEVHFPSQKFHTNPYNVCSVCLAGNTALDDITKNVPSDVFLQGRGTRCKYHLPHFENFPTFFFLFLFLYRLLKECYRLVAHPVHHKANLILTAKQCCMKL